MNIVRVAPIARGIGKEYLDYFSAADIVPGSLVKVPLRSRTIPALVVSVEPAQEMKSELKNSPFAIRKVAKLKSSTIFLPEFIEAVKDTAQYFCGSVGAVFSNILSPAILEQADKIKKIEINSLDKSETLSEPSALQADEEERLAHYKSLIREQFAKKKSVFFCLPTIQDTKKIFGELPKGIEDFTFILNSSQTKKEIIENWNRIITEEHPVLVIATGNFLSIPRKDWGLIILERESSGSYKMQTRPYVDIRTFTEIYAKKIGAKLVLGDLLLRTETLWRTKNGDIAELSALKFRSVSRARDILVDMKKYKTLETPEFRVISNELEDLIKQNKENNENMFIFAARRGLSPVTVCGDCGTTLLCPRCSAPFILHRRVKELGDNYFLCHRCGEKSTAELRCKNCSSWKLTTLGIGIELIEEVLSNMFPEVKFFRLDKDKVKTHKQALQVVENFYASPGSILLGTETALLYLEKPVDNSAIASIDSLFSIPDFRINERIMNIILRVRAISQKIFLVQTRSKDQSVFDYAVKGNLMDFYRDEIDERKKLDYPPFTTLIKLTTKGEKTAVDEIMKQIEKDFEIWNPLVFPAYIETINNKNIVHALMKVKRNEWIAPELKEKLDQLPPQIAINIDPESLL